MLVLVHRIQYAIVSLRHLMQLKKPSNQNKLKYQSIYIQHIYTNICVNTGVYEHTPGADTGGGG